MMDDNIYEGSLEIDWTLHSIRGGGAHNNEGSEFMFNMCVSNELKRLFINVT